jgi:flavin-binding protein dodecin
MAESVYKVIELVGTSTQSWEKAAAAAVKLAGQSLRDLRVAEIAELDMHLVDGKVAAYRARVKVSFKYDAAGGAAKEPAAAPKAPRAAKAPKAEPAPEAPSPAKRAKKKRGR